MDYLHCCLASCKVCMPAGRPLGYYCTACHCSPPTTYPGAKALRSLCWQVCRQRAARGRANSAMKACTAYLRTALPALVALTAVFQAAGGAPWPFLPWLLYARQASRSWPAAGGRRAPTGSWPCVCALACREAPDLYRADAAQAGPPLCACGGALSTKLLYQLGGSCSTERVHMRPLQHVACLVLTCRPPA